MNNTGTGKMMVRNILIVDDEDSIRQLASLILKSEGYCVYEAVNGIDALDKVNGADFHMIITDLQMPRMDGLNFIRQLRRIPQAASIPVVMLTSRRSRGRIKTEGDLAGVDAWIFKPLLHQQLAETVNRYSA
ncbi:MAG: response regulator [Nitrospirae bacterium]|nr:response regulator [Nitrospirota bacterium]